MLQQINEKPSVINEYESGKAIPNPQVLSKMSKVLGVQLSQKSIAKKKTSSWVNMTERGVMTHKFLAFLVVEQAATAQASKDSPKT